MKIEDIIDELENLKGQIWAYVENEEIEVQKKIKEQTNYLLDLLDDLMLEEREKEKWLS